MIPKKGKNMMANQRMSQFNQKKKNLCGGVGALKSQGGGELAR